jgi:broad specificity phosphatase PhoE
MICRMVEQKMQKRYLLVRHGQSQFNAGETFDYDSDITERGYYQIQEASFHVKEVLKTITYNNAYSEAIISKGFVSPYQRTLKTALPISVRLGIEFKVDFRIGESPNDSCNQVVKPIPNRKSDFSMYKWPDFESKDVSKRTDIEYLDSLKEFVAELPPTAIIVSHLSPIKDLISLLCGMSRFELNLKEVPPASLTLIVNGELVFLGKK